LNKLCKKPAAHQFENFTLPWSFQEILLFLYKNKSGSSDVGGGGGSVEHMPQSESLKQVINRKAW
jgi:hypothetical protein